MRVWPTIAMAVGALQVNKVRTALTALGVIIGVGAVVTMMAIGAGAQARVAEQIRSLGSNLIIVLSGSITSGGVRLGSGSQLTDHRGRRARDPARGCERPGRGARDAGRRPGRLREHELVDAPAGGDAGVLRGARVGRDLRATDHVGGRGAASKVVLLGQTVKDNLFGSSDPLGQTVRIKKVPFTVVGVLARKGQSTQGDNQDDTVIVPLSTAKKKVLGTSQANARAVGGDPDQGPRDRAHEGGRAADPRAAPAASPSPGEPGRRLCLAELVGDPGEPGGSLPGHEPAPRRGRGGLPRRGRHRHHEHHAGLGDGAHARDRPAPGRRGAGAATFSASFSWKRWSSRWREG